MCIRDRFINAVVAWSGSISQLLVGKEHRARGGICDGGMLVGVGGRQAFETFAVGPGIGADGIGLRFQNFGFACFCRANNLLKNFCHLGRRMNVLQADEQDARAQLQCCLLYTSRCV